MSVVVHDGRPATVVHRSAQSVAVAVSALAVCLIFLASTILYAELNAPEVWAPLGDYPLQHVTSTVAGIQGPAVHIDGLVSVSATKCNDTHADVTVEGSTLSWQAMDPPGVNITTGSGTAVRHPGCETFDYLNPLPAEVRVAVRAQFAAGIEDPVWRIRGVEVPVDGARQGTPARWATENFRVVP